MYLPLCLYFCRYVITQTRPYGAEAVQTSTHNLSFGAEIRKICIPLHTPVFHTKVGFKGVYIAGTCFPDGGIVYVFIIIDKMHVPDPFHKFNT